MTHQVTERYVALGGAKAEFVGSGEGLRRLVEVISRDWENGGVAILGRPPPCRGQARQPRPPQAGRDLFRPAIARPVGGRLPPDRPTLSLTRAAARSALAAPRDREEAPRPVETQRFSHQDTYP